MAHAWSKIHDVHVRSPTVVTTETLKRIRHQSYSRQAVKQGTRSAFQETRPYQRLIFNAAQMSRLLSRPATGCISE